MKQELQQKLYEKYPKIFRQKDMSMQETAMCWGIACGDGWYNIIDNLCFHLQSLVDSPHEEIARYKLWIEKEKEKDDIDFNEDWMHRCRANIEKEKEKIIPQLEAVQVKEKFGTLRFYLSGYPTNPITDAKIHAYINFAENMSACTCEVCGSPGTQKGRSWITTICEDCERIRDEERMNMILDYQQLKLPFEEN